MKSVIIPIKEGLPKTEAPVKNWYKEKRDKRLCFYCDEKYFHGHNCKLKEKRELNLFIVHDEEEWSEDEQAEEAEAVEVEKWKVADRIETDRGYG